MNLKSNLKTTDFFDMKNNKGYIVWLSPTDRKFVPTYEEAWRHAEDQYQKTGQVALVEAIK